MADEEESLAAVADTAARSAIIPAGCVLFQRLPLPGVCTWQLRNGDNLPLLRETFARKEFDDAGRRIRIS